MKRNHVITAALLLAGVTATILAFVWFLYQVWIDGLQPTFVNALGAAITAIATLALAILTGWYAVTTRRLVETSQAQVGVMRASYAPVIDVEINPADDFLQLTITNRGEGTGRDLRMYFDIKSGDGEFRYTGNISRPIRPGERIAGTSPRAQTTAGSMGGGMLTVVPIFRTDSGTATLPELLEMLADEGHSIVSLQAKVTCHDVIEEKEYSFTPLERKALSTGSHSLKGAFAHAATAGQITVTGPPPESIREHVFTAIRKVRELVLQEDDDKDVPVTEYEEDIEVSII